MKPDQLEKFVTDFLAFTELAVQDEEDPLGDNIRGRPNFGVRGLKRKHHFPLSWIGPVEPFLPEFCDDDETRLFFCDVVPSDLNGQWDVSTVHRPPEEDAEIVQFSLSRVRSIPLKELRGHGKIYGTAAAEQSVAVIYKDKTYLSARSIRFYIGRDEDGQGRWVGPQFDYHLRSSSVDDGDYGILHTQVEEDPESAFYINMALGIAFTRDYEWTVTFALRNIGNPLLMPSDPTGVKHLFCDRNTTDGRREALKHWVEHHWRQKRADPDMEVFVRSHLRGAEPFIWRGFNCVLKASPYDVRRAEQFRQRREQMKREGKTMRLRETLPSPGR